MPHSKKKKSRETKKTFRTDTLSARIIRLIKRVTLLKKKRNDDVHARGEQQQLVFVLEFRRRRRSILRR